jgi:uncharacterized protein DUF6298/collagenase-like protein with putative collagen-binding domain
MRYSFIFAIILLLGAFSQLSLPNASATNRKNPLHLENGWFVHGDRIVWGYAQHNGWWRAGMRPNITRNALGDIRPNRTENLDQLINNMLRYGYPGFEHNFGLWYDRRRDAHDMARRDTSDVKAPFLEQPWARSGKGKAWDGLSKYDLTQFNTWYFNRIKQFADLCSKKGAILFFNFYMQHALLETNAHYVDFPWRTGNCIQNTDMPDKNPAANVFYDVSNPERRRLHQLYIRKCLDELGSYPNIVFLLSEEYTGPQSFMKFWLKVVGDWEKSNNQDVLVALNGTKDIIDALADDERVSVLDLRYWRRKSDGSIDAPPGGQEIPGRFASTTDPANTPAIQFYKQILEYRKRFPKKGIIHMLEANHQQTMAFLMGGGSMLIRYLQYPDNQDPPSYISPADAAIVQPLYDFINAKLSKSIYHTVPMDLIVNHKERNWLLADPNQLYLAYASQGGTIQLDLSKASGSYDVHWFNPKSGELKTENQPTIKGGSIVSFNTPDSKNWLLCLKAN